MDFEINTGKLEPYMEKKNTEELVSWKNRQFFLVFFRGLCSLSVTYSMLHFGKYLAKV